MFFKPIIYRCFFWSITLINCLIINANAQDSLKNKLSLSYDYWHFDKKFNDTFHQNPWHIRSLTYSRSTSYGTFLARINNANRFNNKGNQYEIEAYPHISKGLNGYLNVGISNHYPVFPHYRMGASVYVNLPKSYEVEGGFRLLKFQDQVWIYTAAVGKYVGNYFFNIRSYLVPDIYSISPSFRLTANYYFGGSQNYISGFVGTGFAAENSRFLFDQQNPNFRMFGGLLSKKIGIRHGIKADFLILKQLPQSGIQTGFGLNYSYLF